MRNDQLTLDQLNSRVGGLHEDRRVFLVSGKCLDQLSRELGVRPDAVEIRGPRVCAITVTAEWLLERHQSCQFPRNMEGSISESTFGSDTGESRVGVDPGFEEKETSYSSDVRSGYDEDQPPARAVEEPSEDDVDSHAADIAAGDDDD
jgi:hypothetical protein